jgi:hypothetical protein
VRWRIFSATIMRGDFARTLAEQSVWELGSEASRASTGRRSFGREILIDRGRSRYAANGVEGPAMKLLCVDGIPARGLFTGGIYTQVACWTCCGRYVPTALVSVFESIGHTGAMRCGWCLTRVPTEPTGWYNALRFVPWNPPQISHDEVAELYLPRPLETV